MRNPPLDPNWKPAENPDNPPLSANAPRTSPYMRDSAPAGYSPYTGSRGSASSRPSYGDMEYAKQFQQGTAPVLTMSPQQAMPVPTNQKGGILLPQDRPQQMQQQFPQQMQQQGQGPLLQMLPSPGAQPAASPVGIPTMAQDETMRLYEQEAEARRRFGGDPQGLKMQSYRKAYEQLDKARQAVAADPRFSFDQKLQAFERISARAKDLEAGFAAGSDILQSPTGMDLPPAEEFGELQGGLEPMGEGFLRNPDTGDVMRTMRAPNGQVVPVPGTQSEIDSLPPGTRYMDVDGKVKVSGEAGGRSSTSSRSQASASGQLAPQTPEEAFAAFEKWSKGVDSTPEEMAVADRILATIPDQELRDQLKASLEGADAATIAQTLAQYAPDINIEEELSNARIQAFAREQGSRKSRSEAVAKALGIEIPEEQKPAVDPRKYRVEIGSRGGMRIARRGSGLRDGIPAVRGEDGQIRPAPQAMRELADLEVDTEFVNIRPAGNGKESRLLPFSNETINLGDFALTDRQRLAFSSESRRIEPRTSEEWARFESELQKFQSIGEGPWDPRNLTPRQQALQDLVYNEYSELSPTGKAMMTMYIAHGLGYQVNPQGGYQSTGWARKEGMAGRPATPGAISPPSDQPVQTRRQQDLSQADRVLVDRMLRERGQEPGGPITDEDIQTARRYYNNRQDLDRPRATATPAPSANTQAATPPVSTKAPEAPKPPAASKTEEKKRSEPKKGQGGPYTDYLEYSKELADNDQIIARSERLNRAASQEMEAQRRGWVPEDTSFMDKAFGAATGSRELQAKGRIYAEYERLQNEVKEIEDFLKRNPTDDAWNRDLKKAKSALDAFIKSKGKNFDPFPEARGR